MEESTSFSKTSAAARGPMEAPAPADTPCEATRGTKWPRPGTSMAPGALPDPALFRRQRSRGMTTRFIAFTSTLLLAALGVAAGASAQAYCVQNQHGTLCDLQGLPISDEFTSESFGVSGDGSVLVGRGTPSQGAEFRPSAGRRRPVRWAWGSSTAPPSVLEPCSTKQRSMGMTVLLRTSRG